MACGTRPSTLVKGGFDVPGWEVLFQAAATIIINLCQHMPLGAVLRQDLYRVASWTAVQAWTATQAVAIAISARW